MTLATPAYGDPGTASDASAAISESKRKDILRYLELTRFEDGMRQSMQPMKQQLFQTMLRQNPQIERRDKDLDRIFKQAFGVSFAEFKKRIVQIHNKYYTEDKMEADIEQLETPEGQAWTEHQPALQGDIAVLSSKWSVALGKTYQRNASRIRTGPITSPPIFRTVKVATISFARYSALWIAGRFTHSSTTPPSRPRPRSKSA